MYLAGPGLRYIRNVPSKDPFSPTQRVVERLAAQHTQQTSVTSCQTPLRIVIIPRKTNDKNIIHEKKASK